MKTLFKNIEALGTFDRNQTEWTQAAILVEDDTIAAIGSDPALEHVQADEVIDCSGLVIIPGLSPIITYTRAFSGMSKASRTPSFSIG